MRRIESVISNTTESVPTPNAVINNAFKRIFDIKMWGDSGGGSGPGSTVEYTSQARKIIYEVVQKYKINSMLDAPCGAMVWMPIVLRNLTATNPKFRYHGIDVVNKVVSNSRDRFGNEFKNWKFSVFDFSQRPLPSDYDLIFSRDALQHLPLITVVEALKSFSTAKNSRYLLVGSYLNGGTNKKINIGDYFAINLTQPPFNLKNYVEVFKEGVEFGANEKHLVLYDIPNYLSKIDFNVIMNDALKY